MAGNLLGRTRWYMAAAVTAEHVGVFHDPVLAAWMDSRNTEGRPLGDHQEKEDGS